MAITEKLADFAVEKSFNDIPLNVIHDTKRIILDGIGCAIGGFSMRNCSDVIAEVVRKIGGPKESTMIGKWNKVSCIGAAYANAKLGNLMDMDDVFLNIGHQSPMVLYPALAVGEREKSNGKEFLASVAIGYDVSSRVVLGIGTLFDVIENRVETTEVVGFGQGIFGGAVSAGRLLRLNKAQMINAIGMAGLYTPAPLATKDMSMSKYQVEWGALGSIFAALLSKSGFAGPQTLLDGDSYAKGMGKKTYLKDIVVADLGDKWYISGTSIKPYPTCRHNHYVLDMVNKIAREEKLKPEKISRIVIKGLANYKKPPWNNYEPKNEFELQFSIPFAVALVAYQIRPGPRWMDAELLRNEKLRSLARRVEIEVEPEIAEIVRKSLPLPTLEIPTTLRIDAEGKEYIATTRNAKGDGFSKDARMSDEEVIEKFKENALNVLRKEEIEWIIEKVFNLEKLENIRELFQFKKRGIRK